MPSIVGSIPDVDTGAIARYWVLARERGVRVGRDGLDYNELLHQLLLAGLEDLSV